MKITTHSHTSLKWKIYENENKNSFQFSCINIEVINGPIFVWKIYVYCDGEARSIIIIIIWLMALYVLCSNDLWVFKSV